MVVTSSDYLFHGNTYAPKLKDCYMLNEEGTAFEYVTALKALDAMAPYFTTNLSEETRPQSIMLPIIPESADAIWSLTPVLPKGEGVIYNLNGQMVNGKWSKGNGKLPRGIYIMNGKKVLK